MRAADTNDLLLVEDGGTATCIAITMPEDVAGAGSEPFFDATCDYCEAQGGPVAVLGPCAHVICLQHIPPACRPTDAREIRVVLTKPAECPLCGANVTLALWSRRLDD